MDIHRYGGFVRSWVYPQSSSSRCGWPWLSKPMVLLWILNFKNPRNSHFPRYSKKTEVSPVTEKIWLSDRIRLPQLRPTFRARDATVTTCHDFPWLWLDGSDNDARKLVILVVHGTAIFYPLANGYIPWKYGMVRHGSAAFGMASCSRFRGHLNYSNWFETAS